MTQWTDCGQKGQTVSLGSGYTRDPVQMRQILVLSITASLASGAIRSISQDANLLGETSVVVRTDLSSFCSINWFSFVSCAQNALTDALRYFQLTGLKLVYLDSWTPQKRTTYSEPPGMFWAIPSVLTTSGNACTEVVFVVSVMLYLTLGLQRTW